MSTAHHFDDMTRAAADGVSRRQIVRMLAGGIAGGTLLGGFTSRTAWGAENSCVEQCSVLPRRERGACMRLCNGCRAKGGQICDGGGFLICCQADTSCCADPPWGATCCPPGTRCCMGDLAVGCCPESTECCGGRECCEPGQCCRSTLPRRPSRCCPPGETCCFDITFQPPDNRCGTIDPATGYCVPV